MKRAGAGRFCYPRAVRRPLAAVLVALFVLASAASCSSRSYGASTPAAADARWQRRLEGLARRELGCRSVRLVALNTSVWQVDGCGLLVEYELLCAGRHCSWHRIEPAALRAARDFGCPIGALSATASSATRRELAGCGRAATYSLMCGANHCEWQSYGASAPVAAGYGPAGYGPAGAAVTGSVALPPPATGTVGDESLADVVIPPPPGAYAEPPQDVTAIPPSTTPPAASPPPASGGGATTAPAASTDDVAIPPPPS